MMDKTNIEAQRKEIWPEIYDPDFPYGYEVIPLGRTSEPEKVLLTFKYNDGGRRAVGMKGEARDCVTRAIAIISDEPYHVIHQALSRGTGSQRASKRTPKREGNADLGINTQRKWFKSFMTSLGFTWCPALKVGKTTRVRLNHTDLPSGNLVVALKGHYTAVKNGQLHDVYDCSCNGKRVVLGYWKKTRSNETSGLKNTDATIRG
ncbi:hypothetical protein [Alteromonas mediterranea]|uniref:hypothetical protein n=1 Tax=Alteromonas mediterranea TaxID=314275 RepID=UPI000ABA0D8D|nr:hypothetical protein [Alteromonas mediterranea]